MAVRSKELGNAGEGDPVFAVIYTVPPDRTALVKDVRWEFGNGALNLVVGIARPGVGINVVNENAGALAVNRGAIAGAFIALEPGDLVFVSGAPGVLPPGAVRRVWVSGAELGGVAP